MYLTGLTDPTVLRSFQPIIIKWPFRTDRIQEQNTNSLFVLTTLKYKRDEMLPITFLYIDLLLDKPTINFISVQILMGIVLSLATILTTTIKGELNCHNTIIGIPDCSPRLVSTMEDDAWNWELKGEEYYFVQRI